MPKFESFKLPPAVPEKNLKKQRPLMDSNVEGMASRLPKKEKATQLDDLDEAFEMDDEVERMLSEDLPVSEKEPDTERLPGMSQREVMTLRAHSSGEALIPESDVEDSGVRQKAGKAWGPPTVLHEIVGDPKVHGKAQEEVTLGLERGNQAITGRKAVLGERFRSVIETEEQEVLPIVKALKKALYKQNNRDVA